MQVIHCQKTTRKLRRKRNYYRFFGVYSPFENHNMQKGTLAILLSFVSLITGCSSVYMPNVPNTPMLSVRGELHGAAHITPKSNMSFNTAYAVSDHFGILVNGSLMNRNREKKDFRHNLVEAAGGYYTTFGAENDRIFEIYAGTGRGNADRIFKEATADGLIIADRQEVAFQKFFVQANYSAKRKKSIRLFKKVFPLNYGTALRVSHIKMSEFIRNDLAEPLEDNIFFEPVFFTRLALGQGVQLQYSSGSNFGLKNRKFLTAGHSVFSVGVVINTGTLSLKP